MIRKFLLKSFGYGLVLYGASLTPAYARALEWIAAGYAGLAYSIITPFDATLLHHGDTLWSTSAGAAVSVHTACTGHEIVGLIAVIMLAWPASMRSRAYGVAGAVLLVAVVNLARIVSVYWIETRHPAVLTLAHEEVWPVILNFSAIAALVGWFQWLKRDEPAPPALAT